MMSKPLAVPGVGLAAAADDELVLAPDHHVLRLAVAPPPGLGWVVRGGGGVLTLDVDQNRRPRALGLKSVMRHAWRVSHTSRVSTFRNMWSLGRTPRIGDNLGLHQSSRKKSRTQKIIKSFNH